MKTIINKSKNTKYSWSLNTTNPNATKYLLKHTNTEIFKFLRYLVIPNFRAWYWLLCLGRWAAWCAWAGLGWSGLGWAGLPDLPPPPPHLWVCLVWFGLSLSQYYCTNCTIKHWQYDIYYLQNIHEIKVSWWNNYKCINYLYKTKPLTFDLHVKFKSKLKYKENIILPPKSLFCPLIGCSG